jgi:hypothetical protein
MLTPTINEVLNNPCTSYWLKDAIRTAFNRDILDALRDAELLAKLLDNRRAEIERLYWQAVENR